MGALLTALDGRCVVVMRRIAFFGVMGMLFIAGLTVTDVLLRWLVSAPIHGVNEVVEMGIAVAIAATFPAGAAGRVNLSIDLLASSLGETTKSWLRVVGTLFLLVFYIFLAWRMGAFAVKLHARHAVTLYLEMPQAPFIWAIATLLGLCVVVQLLAFTAALRDTIAGIAAPDAYDAFSGFAGAEKKEAQSETAVQVPDGKLAVATAALLVAVVAVLFLAEQGVTAFAATAQTMPGGVAVVAFLVMWGLLVLLVPLGPAMGLVGLTGTALLIGTAPALTIIGTETVEFLTKAELAVLPLFLMMGSFAAAAGLSRDIYELAHILLGHRRGGLALATVGGCGGFGALTGSSLATTATIGRVALPEMRARGYSPGLATGCIAAGGTLGALVPPSIPIVLYAILTEESIGQLFIGAIIPAALAIFLYMVAISLYVRLVADAAPPAERRANLREILLAVRKSWGVLFLFALVIGGLYGGVFTVTEAAAVGAGGAFLFALFRGKLSGGAIWQVMGETTATTAMIYILIFGAVTFSFFIGLTGLPELLTSFIGGLQFPPLAVVAILLVIYIILGSIMDPFPVMVITVPIIAPLIQGLGYDLVWWGIIMVCVVETGMITPPFGINVFVLKSIASDVPMATVFRGVTVFVIADLVKLAILVLIPALVLWLPATMID